MTKVSDSLRCLFPFPEIPQAVCAIALLLIVFTQPVLAQEQDAEELPTPPRIGMVTGEASFARPGADNWSPAQVNTPLAAGDTLYTAAGATLEVQIGSHAFVRMAQNAMLTLLNDEPNLQQFKITSGIAAFDLRNLPTGRSIEIDTPSGAFNIDNSGYYRAEISDNATHFIVRRGGEATVTLADGNSRLIAPSQEAVVEPGDGQGDVDTYVAPDADTWDNWNYARTDDLIDAISNRYVSPDVYGTDDLDHYGNWRTTPDYGAVWVPSGMAADWAPYSNGSWVWDPVYAWTWVDAAPWGWAPYHYGRWVNINGFWAWAPGPRQHRPAYAPALVAFFHNNGGAVQINAGGPGVSWVALGWGEPCLPWWGRTGFAGRPWWGGWAGPRVVNNVVIQRNTVVNNITNNTYHNLNQRNAVITMPENHFGHGRVAGITHIEPARVNELKAIVGQPPMHPEATSFAPSAAKAAMPAANVMNRSAVVLHSPPARASQWQVERHDRPQAQQIMPESKVITVRPQAGQQAPWARFGQSAGLERNEPRRSPDPPRVETWSPQTASQIRQENNVPKPLVQERAMPQQQPERIMITSPAQQRQQEPVRSFNAPPQAPVIMQREAPRIPAVAPPQAMRPMPRHETNQERRESPHEMERQQAPAALPGKPANQLYQRRAAPAEQSKTQ